MSKFEKKMIVALTFSTVMMLLNIAAVSSGMADSYYGQLSLWLQQL